MEKRISHPTDLWSPRLPIDSTLPYRSRPISIKKFYFISQIGMLPATIVYVYAGSEISKINQIKDIMSIELLLSFILIASLPIILKLLLKKFKLPI